MLILPSREIIVPPFPGFDDLDYDKYIRRRGILDPRPKRKKKHAAGAFVVGSGLHTTGVTGTIPSTTSGDLLIAMVKGNSGHATSAGWAELGYIQDGPSGFITMTCLAKISTGGTTGLTVGGAGIYYDACAFSGMSSINAGTNSTFGTLAGDPGSIGNARINPAVATPTGTVTAVLASASNASAYGTWGWDQGSASAMGGSITTLYDNNSAVTFNNSGYEVGVAAGTYNPGMTGAAGAGGRFVLLIVFLQESSGGGSTGGVVSGKTRTIGGVF